MSSDVSETTHIHNKTNQIDNTTLNSQRAPYLITKKNKKYSLCCVCQVISCFQGWDIDKA